MSYLRGNKYCEYTLPGTKYKHDVKNKGSFKTTVVLVMLHYCRLYAVLWIRIPIRIRLDPELLKDPDPGINSFESGSDQTQFGMNFMPNFSVKNQHFSNEMR
jgi:hypothetical protein